MGGVQLDPGVTLISVPFSLDLGTGETTATRKRVGAHNAQEAKSGRAQKSTSLTLGERRQARRIETATSPLRAVGHIGSPPYF